MKKIFLLTILSAVLNTILYSQNIFTVTKVSDPDPFDHPYNYIDSLCDTAMYGTLQWAIRKTNDAPPPCEIRFNIPGTGQHIINLNFSFPAINKQVKIDGSSQPGYNYNNGPSIIIDGTNIPYNSACFNINADSSVIKGLLIQNFYLSYGIIILGTSDVKIKDNIFQNVGGWNPSLAYYRAMSVYIAAPNCVIQGNIFGTDITGTVNYGSTAEAIYLQNQSQPADNCLIGGSGANEPNIVANSGWGGGWAGVSILNGKYNRISRNKIYNNPLGISLLIYAGPGWWGNEGRPSPVIDSLTPSGILYGTSQPDDFIELFGSSGPQNANEYLQSVVADASGNWNASMVNFIWSYFIATATDAANNTSELSNAYEIIIPPPMAACATATEITIDSICIPQNYLGQTTDIWFKFIPDTANVDLNISYPSTAAASIDRMHVYEGDCDSLILYAQVNNDTLYLYDLTPGINYYLKLHASQIGYFNICGQKGETIFIPPDYEIEPPAGNGAYYINRGQIIDTYNNLRPDIKYYSRSSSPEIYLSDTAISFVLAHVDTILSTIDTLCRVDMKLAGNSHLSRPYKKELAAGYHNYYLGHCPQGVTNVNGFYRVVYPDAYPGINLQCYSNSMGAKFYFVVKPGAKSENIILKFNGADAVNIDGNGNLIIQTSLGNIEFEHAQCYKVNPAGNVVPMPNQGDYVQLSATEIGFNLQQPPGNTMPVVIMMDKGHYVQQPQANENLLWSTFWGEINNDYFVDVKVDASENVYYAGQSASSVFPTSNGSIFTHAGSDDAIVIKLNDQCVPQWTNFFGGIGIERTSAIGITSQGKVIITGRTSSDTIPFSNIDGIYSDHINSATGQYYDVFIAKFSNTGQSLLWSTFYGGGTTGDYILANDLAIDVSDNLYIVGGSNSNTIPLFPQSGAYNSTSGGGFILKFDASGDIKWATRFLGSPSAVITDGLNNVFITGQVSNTSLPTVDAGGDIIDTYAGEGDAFVTEFNSSNQIIWSTYYGGSKVEVAHAIAIDELNDFVYVGGFTRSPETSAIPFPVFDSDPFSSIDFYIPQFQSTLEIVPGEFQEDAYLLRFNKSTGAIQWATYYGGFSNDYVEEIVVDNNGFVYVVGGTKSGVSGSLGTKIQFPASNPAGYYVQDNLKGDPATDSDGWLAVFTKDLKLVWTTYYGRGITLGGYVYDGLFSVAVLDHDLYLAGYTYNSVLTNLPPVEYNITPGSSDYYQPIPNTGIEGLAARFDISNINILAINSAVQENAGVILFPNPSSGDITLQLSFGKTQDITISIYNLLGERMFSKVYINVAGNAQLTMNLDRLASGMYVIQIKSDETTLTQKLIKH